jgi:hypothetical protein
MIPISSIPENHYQTPNQDWGIYMLNVVAASHPTWRLEVQHLPASRYRFEVIPASMGKRFWFGLTGRKQKPPTRTRRSLQAYFYPLWIAHHSEAGIVVSMPDPVALDRKMYEWEKNWQSLVERAAGMSGQEAEDAPAA